MSNESTKAVQQKQRKQQRDCNLKIAKSTTVDRQSNKPNVRF